MNSEKGVDPKQELDMLCKAGFADKAGFQQYPFGEFGPDASTDADGSIEVRRKDFSMAGCQRRIGDNPTGVEINISTVQGYADKDIKSFIFIVECPVALPFPLVGTARAGYRAVVDVETALRHYERGLGRGRQPVCGVPVNEFERIY